MSKEMIEGGAPTACGAEGWRYTLNQKCPKTPELDKMHVVRSASQSIGRFIDWLRGHRMEICYREEGKFLPMPESVEKLLARYFEIDLNKVEEERQALLTWQRALNEKKA